MKTILSKAQCTKKPGFLKEKMTRYTIKGLEGYSFDASTDSEFIQKMRENHRMPMEDDSKMLRLMAVTYREYWQSHLGFQA